MNSKPKIFYGAGPHSGANLALHRFLKNYEGQVLSIAHTQYHHLLPTIDLNADALYSSLLKDKQKIANEYPNVKSFKANYYNFVDAFDIVKSFDPDIVICDYEYYSLQIAQILNIPIVSCSPLNLIKGAYREFKTKISFDRIASRFAILDKIACRKFIYSPFGLVSGRPILKEGYEWVNPYHEQSSLEDATSSSIADALFEGRPVAIKSLMKDHEQLLNGIWVEQLGIGCMIGVSDRPSYIRRKLESFQIQSKLDYQPWGYLHEKI